MKSKADMADEFWTQILIPETQYIYRAQHRIMEGNCQYDHGPRLIQLKSFYIDKYPVTNEKFGMFLEESGYWPNDDHNFLKHWYSRTYPASIARHPVVWVSPTDARAYCAWFGGRLPSDPEWQYAAGGAAKRKWPWGDQFDSGKCNAEHTALMAVDQYPEGKSPFGCYDMCGNAWEWVDDVRDGKQYRFTFLRGGSFYKAPHAWHAEGGPHPVDSHLKFQLLNEGLNRCETVGFRCVKEVGNHDN